MKTQPVLTKQLDVQIALALPAEIAAIWELYQKVWLTTYPNKEAGISKQDIAQYLRATKNDFVRQWQDAIAHPGEQRNDERAVFVARSAGQIIGVVSPKIAKDGKHRLTSLYVSPAAQGMGVGTKLISRVLDWHAREDVYLYVAPYLLRAQKLYERFDFRIINPTEYTYFDGAPVPYIEMVRSAR